METLGVNGVFVLSCNEYGPSHQTFEPTYDLSGPSEKLDVVTYPGKDMVDFYLENQPQTRGHWSFFFTGVHEGRVTTSAVGN